MDTYFATTWDGADHHPDAGDAYVHVRLADRVSGTGSVMVYLPDGTALVVPARDLIRLAPARHASPVR
jgi:hypothetical protein